MTLKKDESEMKKSISGITNEEWEANKAKHEHGISTTTTISRHALCIFTLCCMLTVYNFVHISQNAKVSFEPVTQYTQSKTHVRLLCNLIVQIWAKVELNNMMKL
jgi:hypothetical protein